MADKPASWDSVPDKLSYREQMWVILLRNLNTDDEYTHLRHLLHIARRQYGKRTGSLMKETGEIMEIIQRRLNALDMLRITKHEIQGMLENPPEVYSHSKKAST